MTPEKDTEPCAGPTLPTSVTRPFIGLTGNIGCGKSTVANGLDVDTDTVILDCDRIAKEIIRDGIYSPELRDILGADVLPSNSERINFGKIADIIFRDPEKKKLFEELIHPIVWNRVENRASEHTPNKIFIVESALIFEKKIQDKFSKIIVVTCNEQEQIRRLVQDRKMDYEQIRLRISHQLPSKYKEERADYLIATDCDEQELWKRIRDLLRKLKEELQQTKKGQEK